MIEEVANFDIFKSWDGYGPENNTWKTGNNSYFLSSSDDDNVFKSEQDSVSSNLQIKTAITLAKEILKKLRSETRRNLVKVSFSDRAAKICAIALMVLTFTK